MNGVLSQRDPQKIGYGPLVSRGKWGEGSICKFGGAAWHIQPC